MKDELGEPSAQSRRRGPGCGAVFVGLAVVIFLPQLLARFIPVQLALASFVLLLVAWLILLYSVPGGARSYAFAIETKKFPVDPEGDLVTCNGMPGSKVVQYLSEALKDSVAGVDEAIQEDYGWGCYCEKQGCRIWLAVSYAGPIDGSRVLPAEWVISTTHERTLRPKQWARSNLGMRVAAEIHASLLATFRADLEIRVLWAEGT